VTTRSRRARRAGRRQPAPLWSRLHLSPFLPARSWRLQLVAVAVGLALAIVSILSSQSFASAREGPNVYLIRGGDTLLGIAASTGVALDRLIALNGIQDPDVIIAGQTLQLDGAAGASAPPSTPGPAPAGHYTVKAGDTLWDIAQANNVSFDALVKLNGLSNADQLSVGQQLALPPSQSGQTAARARPSAATATPKPTTSAQASPLLQKITAQVRSIGGPNVAVGVAATNLTSGERIALHADDAFPSASVMKLPILVELERQVNAGTLSWTDSLRNEAAAMIAVSDNSAANQIADAIHPQSVNDTMARLGLGATRFVNPFSDATSRANPSQNQTTPANMARLLELIATDQIVNPQVSADIRGLLARNADRSKLVRLLPPDARVAHKSGWYEGVANDVGIVSVDRVPTRWVIAVFTQNLPDAETGNQVIAAVSKAVYDAWAP
jgi:beta-lactamase class A